MTFDQVWEAFDIKFPLEVRQRTYEQLLDKHTRDTPFWDDAPWVDEGGEPLDLEDPDGPDIPVFEVEDLDETDLEQYLEVA
ncbi:MAG: hypothetical protein AAGA48_28635 [Myxococcota bacterium]